MAMATGTRQRSQREGAHLHHLHGENFFQPVLGSPGFVFLKENGLPGLSVALNSCVWFRAQGIPMLVGEKVEKLLNLTKGGIK